MFLLWSLVIGSSFMSISWLVLELWQFSFNKGLTRNPDMGNKISGDWVELLRDTKFGTNVPNKILLNAANGQGYCFFRFLVIMGKSTGGKITPLPRLALSISGIFTYFNIDNWQTHYQIQEFCDTRHHETHVTVLNTRINKFPKKQEVCYMKTKR